MSDFVNTRTSNGDQATLDALIANTLTELKEDGVRALGVRSLYKNVGLTLVDFPSVTSAGEYALSGCTNLNSVNLEALGSVPQYMFAGDTAITVLNLPEATSVGQYAFQNVPIVKLSLPKVATLGAYMTNGNGAEEVDLSANPSVVANAFNGDVNLTSLILRNSSQLTLANVSAFTGTPIAQKFGWIYVPSELVSTYKAATNWSTYASQIVSLDEYPKDVTGSITDTWAEIFAAEEDGTYSTKYKVGDTKMVSVNGSPVAMQIVAIDGDELADGTGNAKITWLCLGYQGKHNMNSTNTTSGGWASCAMRQYLIDSVLPNIDSTVRAQIKSVNKTYYDYASSSTKVSADSIWIPSFREVGFGTTKEDSGVIYSGIFTDNAARIKKDGLYALGTAAYWWLRSASNGNIFYGVNTGGGSTNNYASTSNGVVFGFCT